MGLFHHGTSSSGSSPSSPSSSSSNSSSTSTCNPQDWGTVQPVVGTMTYHTLISIIAGACTILAIIICGLLAATHLFKFRRPDEQKQIVRIVWTPAIIAIFSIFGVWFYDVAGYVKPIGEYYECFSLVAIFYLFIHYATPDDAKGRHPFCKLDMIAATHDNANITTLYKTWLSVMQILVVRLITLVAGFAVAGSECKLLSKTSKAQTVLSVIQVISTVVCLMALIRTYKVLKSNIKGYSAVLKLVCLKVIVGLDVTQSFVFSILANNGDIKPTTYLDLPDLMIGTQDFILCCECFLISILFIYAYSASRYSERNYASHAMEGQQRTFKKKNFCVAMFDALNISDIIMGLFYCLQAWSGRRGTAAPGTYDNSDVPLYNSGMYDRRLPK